MSIEALFLFLDFVLCIFFWSSINVIRKTEGKVTRLWLLSYLQIMSNNMFNTVFVLLYIDLAESRIINMKI